MEWLSGTLIEALPQLQLLEAGRSEDGGNGVQDVSVYVDPLMSHGWVLRGKSIQSCHLLADSDEELHVLARRIGLRRSWFQQGSRPHYDLVPSKRILAVQRGAIELKGDSLREFMLRTRPQGNST